MTGRGASTGVRNADVKARYLKGGETLQNIGDRYGISHERVRQILKAQGVSGRDVVGTRKAKRDQQKRKAREARCQKRHGLSWDKLSELREIEREMVREGCSLSRTPLYAFRSQRRNAKERGIEWQLTLGEWWEAWGDSGLWDFRGRGQNKYVMSRFGDVGPYHPDNVFIQQAVENNSNRPQKVMGLPMGVRQTPNGRFSAHRMTNGKMRYLGSFDTVDEARHAYQRNRRTLVRKKSGLPTGVRPQGRRYSAQIRTGDKTAWLGSYNTPQEASAAYQAAKAGGGRGSARPSEMAFM